MIFTTISSAILLAFTFIGAEAPPVAYDFSIVDTESRKKGGQQYTLLVVKAVVSHEPDSLEKARVEQTMRLLLSKVRDDARRDGHSIDGVSVLLYQSKAHLDGGNGPIGIADWWPKEHSFSASNEANIKNKSTYVETLTTMLLQRKASNPLVRLSEELRREIYSAIIKAEDRAYREAEEKFPIDGSKVPIDKLRTYDRKTMLDQNSRESSALMKKYKRDVAQKYKLTDAELEQVGDEGLERQWPFPPRE